MITKLLLRVFLLLLVCALFYWLGGLVITAFGAPAIFLTIWMVVCILAAVFGLFKLFGGELP